MSFERETTDPLREEAATRVPLDTLWVSSENGSVYRVIGHAVLENSAAIVCVPEGQERPVYTIDLGHWSEEHFQDGEIVSRYTQIEF